ncbi:MAG: hypothetical protein HY562_10880 [Ignavibacteriales bacterium]|nr:hypothetical protein [Ignavibacteriales bacterium]
MKHIPRIVLTSLLSLSALSAQEDSVSYVEPKKNSLGVGLGIPYGVLGANLDVNIVSTLYASMGIGTSALAGVAHNVGLKYFVLPVSEAWRPRVSAFYGTNTLAEITIVSSGSSTTDRKKYLGLSLGIGVQWMWGDAKSNGLDFDIIYIATRGLDIEGLRNQGFAIDEPTKVGFSLGYRHGF